MAEQIPKLSDEELACEVQVGSLAAFEELASRYERRIFGFLRQRSSYEDAQDLTQKTFLTAYRKIQQYNSHYRFVTWLFTIARRLSISHYRSRSMAKTTLPDDIASENDPTEDLAAREDRGRLWLIARRELPEDQFSAVWMRYAEDLPIKEIAVTLEKSESNVKVMLHRARTALSRYVRVSNEIQR